MGLFGTKIKPGIPASGGGMTTQSVGAPSSSPATASSTTPPVKMTVPIVPTGSPTGGGRGVVITLIPSPTSSPAAAGSPAPVRATSGAGGIAGGAGGGYGTGITGGGGSVPTVDTRLGSSIARDLGNTAGIATAPVLIQIEQASIYPGTGGASNLIRMTPSPSGDVINVAETMIQNGQFRPVMDSGVHRFRPEIIMNSEFNTIWEPGILEFHDDIRGNRQLRKQSPTGDFLNFQFQTKQLRQETVAALIKNIQTTLGDPQIFNDVKKEYTGQLEQIGQDLKYLENIVTNINVIKAAFDIKNIPVQNYEYKSGERVVKVRTLKQVFSEKMQYRPEQFDIFSSTKVMLQLLIDLENMLASYSAGLMSLEDPDRINDYSPDILDQSYTTKSNNFTFSIKNFASIQLDTVVNAAETGFFTRFMSSLPPGPNDRIRLLTYLLAKEYSVSRGIGKRSNQEVLQNVKYDKMAGSNPFRNAIGVPGRTIYDAPLGIPDSLASLMFINPNNPAVKILSFENKYIDNDDQRFTYIPGTAFFADSILTVDGKSWDSNALTAYVNRYNNIVSSVRTLVNDIFGLEGNNLTSTTEVESGAISPTEMNKRFLLTIKTSYGVLTPNESSTLKDLTTSSSNSAQRRLLLEEQISYINGSIGRPDTSEAQRAAYNSQITAIRAKIDTLSLPTLDDSLNISLDKSTIMALFKFVSSGHDDIKIMLYKFCLLSAMARNRPDTNLDDIFSLIASNEIETTDQLSLGRFAGSSKPTDNGSNLIHVIEEYSKLLNISLSSALSLTSAGRQLETEGILKYYIQESSIADLLYRCARGEGPSGEQNLIYQFINLANHFFNSGRIDGQNAHIVNFGAATRYNYLSCSTQALFVFETLCQYAAAYGPATFASRDLIAESAPDFSAGGLIYLNAPISSIKTIGIAIDYTKMNKIVQAIDLLTTSTTEEEKDAVRKQNNRQFIDLEANHNKIAAEFETVVEMLQNLKIIGDHLQSSLTQVQGFFNQKGLQDFLKKSPATNLNLLQNYSQLRLASFIYNDIKERTNATTSFMKSFGGAESSQNSTGQSELIISETTTDSEYNALVSFLSDTNNATLQCVPSDSHPADVIKRNNKILAVGIPAGFSRELADRVNRSQINAQTFQEKQSDVITVKVYLRNLKFNDLVFKPLKFVFDLSLFATRKDFVDCNVAPGEAIVDILSRISLTDLDNPFSPQKINAEAINTDSKYDFLTETQRNDLIKNHVASYLLSIYMQYITGVKTTEDIFLEPPPPPKKLSTKAKTILDTYVKQTFGILPGTAVIKDIITARSLPENMKDAYRLLTYGSLLFCDNEVKSRVLTPKTFDRVFYIPVCIDNIEIDLDATSLTTTGRNTLHNTYTQDHIRTNPPGISTAGTQYFLDAYTIEDFIINDMFISVETANDTEAQDAVALQAAGELRGTSLIRETSTTTIIAAGTI